MEGNMMSSRSVICSIQWSVFKITIQNCLFNMTHDCGRYWKYKWTFYLQHFIFMNKMVVRGYNTSSSFSFDAIGSDFLIQDIIRYAIGLTVITENILNISLICFFQNLRSKTNAILSSLAVVDMITGIMVLVLPHVPYQLQGRSSCFLSYSLLYAVTSN